ncbi:MAG: hypothetical protein WC373_05645 [Smithella sp.]|jgi:hypothetical protein
MRIKFEKGITPERMAETLVRHIYENNIVIGAVNVYVQTYDNDMKPEKFNHNEKYLSCSPSEKAKNEYDEYAARIRRGKFKAVSGE